MEFNAKARRDIGARNQEKVKADLRSSYFGMATERGRHSLPKRAQRSCVKIFHKLFFCRWLLGIFHFLKFFDAVEEPIFCSFSTSKYDFLKWNWLPINWFLGKDYRKFFSFSKRWFDAGTK
jgi:hypothetical protein